MRRAASEHLPKGSVHVALVGISTRERYLREASVGGPNQIKGRGRTAPRAVFYWTKPDPFAERTREVNAVAAQRVGHRLDPSGRLVIEKFECVVHPDRWIVHRTARSGGG